MRCEDCFRSFNDMCPNLCKYFKEFGCPFCIKIGDRPPEPVELPKNADIEKYLHEAGIDDLNIEGNVKDSSDSSNTSIEEIMRGE